jgi:hypothetical protein
MGRTCSYPGSLVRSFSFVLMVKTLAPEYMYNRYVGYTFMYCICITILVDSWRKRKWNESLWIVSAELELLINAARVSNRRSQWPGGLRREMSSLAQTQGFWVRNPLEAWMTVRVHSAFVLSCVGSGLAPGLIPRLRSPTNCVRSIVPL